MRIWLVRIRRMTTSDYMTAVEVLRLAVWVEIAIRLMPFSRLLERVRPAASGAPPAAVVASDHRCLVRFVALAYDILPLPTTCLRQSLVLHALLARRGVPSRFCLGVARNGPALAAHAWVELDGIGGDGAATGFSELRPR
jgi:hypothetical protein